VPLTTDQFRKYVWTEAGFDRYLEARLATVELPPRTPAGPAGPVDPRGSYGHA
jgi:hypothetical protein